MPEQLTLDGDARILGLTERQQFALETIERLGGCTLDELGAHMHARRGKHQPDSRCDYCQDEGSQVAGELRGKDWLRRLPNGIWASVRTLGEGDATAGNPASPSPSGPAGSSGIRTEARTRSTDPATSHQAAATVHMNGRHAAVLDSFRRHGPMTDEQLHVAYERDVEDHGVPAQSDSGLRTRRHELVEAGLLVDSGERAPTVAGRDAIVWGVADDGTPW